MVSHTAQLAQWEARSVCSTAISAVFSVTRSLVLSAVLTVHRLTTLVALFQHLLTKTVFSKTPSMHSVKWMTQYHVKIACDSSEIAYFERPTLKIPYQIIPNDYADMQYSTSNL